MVSYGVNDCSLLFLPLSIYSFQSIMLLIGVVSTVNLFFALFQIVSNKFSITRFNWHSSSSINISFQVYIYKNRCRLIRQFLQFFLSTLTEGCRSSSYFDDISSFDSLSFSSLDMFHSD